MRDDVKVLKARMPHWLLEPARVNEDWRELATFTTQLRRLSAQQGVIEQEDRHGPAADHEAKLTDDVNKLDVAKVAAEAKAYRYSR